MYMYTHMYICIYIYIHICVHIYIYICVSLYYIHEYMLQRIEKTSKDIHAKMTSYNSATPLTPECAMGWLRSVGSIKL